jgi:hypothetical protein
MRSQAYHPVAGLTLVLVTGLAFWGGLFARLGMLLP